MANTETARAAKQRTWINHTIWIKSMNSVYVSMHAGAYVYAMTDRNACDSLTEDSFSGLCHKDYIENICVPVQQQMSVID